MEAPNVSVHVSDSTSAESKSTESNPQEEKTSAELCTACGWTEEQLAHALQGNLSQYAAVFLDAERTYHVNAVFLASVAAHESGWGKSKLAIERNNLFGIKSGDSYKRFSSKEACILYAAEYLSVNYLSPDGRYFHGYEVKDVCVRYCGSDNWTRQIERIMNDINERCSEQSRKEEQEKAVKEQQTEAPQVCEPPDTASQASKTDKQNHQKKQQGSRATFTKGPERLPSLRYVSFSY